MSAGLYSHTTRAIGTILTAEIYNSDHQNHVTNHNPAMMGGYSDTIGEMQSTADPGAVGDESLALSLSGELERIRYQLNRIIGKDHWYEAPLTDLNTPFADTNGTFTSNTGSNQTPLAQVSGGVYFNLDWDDDLTGLTAEFRIGRSTNADAIDLILYEPNSSIPAFRIVTGDGDAFILGNVRATFEDAQEIDEPRNNKIMTPLRTHNSIMQRRASQTQAEAGESNDVLMTPLRTAQAIGALASGTMHVQDQRSGHGGTFFAGGWRTRNLNTVVSNDIDGASLSSNRITLPAGKYLVNVSATAYRVQQHRLKLRNITDSTDLFHGVNNVNQESDNGDGNNAHLSGIIILNDTKTIELQHRCASTRGTDGFGQHLLSPNIYANVLIVAL